MKDNKNWIKIQEYHTLTIVLCFSLTVIETKKIFFLIFSILSPLFSANLIYFLISFVIRIFGTFLPSTISNKSSYVNYLTAFSYASSCDTFYSPKNYPSSYF